MAQRDDRLFGADAKIAVAQSNSYRRLLPLLGGAEPAGADPDADLLVTIPQPGCQNQFFRRAVGG